MSSGSSRPRTTTYVEEGAAISNSSALPTSKWSGDELSARGSAVEASGAGGGSSGSAVAPGAGASAATVGAAAAGGVSSSSSSSCPGNAPSSSNTASHSSASINNTAHAASNYNGMKKASKDSKVMTVIASHGHSTFGLSDRSTEISYKDTKVIGNGSFGVVYQARLCATNELVAIKKVLQDKRFKNRELQIMRRLEHCNIVKLLYFFYTSGDKKDEIYLNLVLEYIPETVYKVARQYSKSKQTIPAFFIKLYMYQLFRSLAFIHHQGICHRDIKPQNLLLDPESGILKLCDFGSAKHLIRGEPNVSYICSRYYRAPELIFGAVDYSTSIDIWSAGCVFAELMLCQPIFPGDSGVDQLVEIIKILGTPTREQIKEMNPNYTEFKFPQIKAHPWQKVFRARTSPEAIDLVSSLLEYTPTARIRCLQACAHSYFDELREPGAKLPNGRDLPPLFNFRRSELMCMPYLNSHLIPAHMASAAESTTADSQESASSSGAAATSASASEETKAPSTASASTTEGAAASATKDDSMNQGSPTGGNS
eukprot:TRINITY_DN976_c0_g1_i1.p1 TRINITY_DN976_c0_g1~~TRINITY_DN976_c0_g1_i1.p1  ORF type:complete len:539 (-),score=153.09 TRINITY_DN976_c0_g1_i1:2016-3632(-)